MNALVGMDPPEKDQMIAALFLERVQREVDSVVNRRQVIQPGSPIGIADGNEISIPIFLVKRHDLRGRESMDGGEDRRLYQPGVGQRHEVVMAVDQVKLSRMLEGF